MLQPALSCEIKIMLFFGSSDIAFTLLKVKDMFKLDETVETLFLNRVACSCWLRLIKESSAMDTHTKNKSLEF